MRPIKILHAGRPLKEFRKCGCVYKEQAGGTHMGRGAWLLNYDWHPCEKHDGRPRLDADRRDK